MSRTLFAASARRVPPAAPVISTSAFTVGGTITWSAVSGAAAYDAYRDGVLAAAGVTSPYTILAADVGPTWTLKARNAVGSSAASNSLQYATSSSGTLAWWLRGDVVVLNGSNVASWTDQSGNSRHFAQATPALQPAYTASAINGRPGVTFSAVATQLLTGPSIAALTGAEGFIVLQLNADPPSVNTKCGLWRVGTGASDVVPFTDGKIYDGFGSTLRKTTVDPATSMATPCIYSVISVTGEWTNFLNGTQLFTTATNTTAFNTIPLLGGNPTGPNYLDGVVCEWIAYNAKLSSNGRADVTAYLKNRYGIA